MGLFFLFIWVISDFCNQQIEVWLKSYTSKCNINATVLVYVNPPDWNTLPTEFGYSDTPTGYVQAESESLAVWGPEVPAMLLE